MTLTDTIPIVFSGGTYGTYLEWALTMLTTDCDIFLPFNSNGNSHKFRGNPLRSIHGWNNYIEHGMPLRFVRLHPKISKEESISKNLNAVLSTVDRMIFIYPDKNSVLLVVNNMYTKIWKDWWSVRLTDPEFSNNLYSSWKIAPDTPIDQIPVWIKREILSFNLMPSWYDSIEWNLPDHWQDPKCIILNVTELLYQFELTLQRIQNFCNLKFIKNIKQLELYHKEMLRLQQYLNQDKICEQIIQSIISDYYFEWEQLPLISQSWVQWQLRNLGFEIQCNELNIFPRNSAQLKKLIYKT
jgi:hypothetical protein